MVPRVNRVKRISFLADKQGFEEMPSFVDISREFVSHTTVKDATLSEQPKLIHGPIAQMFRGRGAEGKI